jgi:hypothetical protein
MYENVQFCPRKQRNETKTFHHRDTETQRKTEIKKVSALGFSLCLSVSLVIAKVAQERFFPVYT